MEKRIGDKSKIFGIFMLVFQYPDREFIEQLQNKNLYSIIKSYLEDNYSKDANNKLMDSLMIDLDHLLNEYSTINFEKLFSDLKAEYHSLFIGYKTLLAPPYASVYWDSTKQLMRQPAILLKRFYKEWGFEISNDYKDLPDHISLQLEFLYQLGEKSNKDNEYNIYNVQKKVIEDIILRWIYKFSENINEYQELKFYGIMIEILINILEKY